MVARALHPDNCSSERAVPLSRSGDLLYHATGMGFGRVCYYPSAVGGARCLSHTATAAAVPVYRLTRSIAGSSSGFSDAVAVTRCPAISISQFPDLTVSAARGLSISAKPMPTAPPSVCP